jgi:hypothetical protein
MLMEVAFWEFQVNRVNAPKAIVAGAPDISIVGACAAGGGCCWAGWLLVLLAVPHPAHKNKLNNKIVRGARFMAITFECR